MNLISYYIIGQAILQLKFGPLQHCVTWINPHDVRILCVHACISTCLCAATCM